MNEDRFLEGCIIAVFLLLVAVIFCGCASTKGLDNLEKRMDAIDKRTTSLEDTTGKLEGHHNAPTYWYYDGDLYVPSYIPWNEEDPLETWKNFILGEDEFKPTEVE